MEILGVALAGLIGLSLGLLGGGGSILTVPIFVYVLGFDSKTAIALALPVVGGASLIGAVGHWKAGNVDLKLAALFGAVAMVGAYSGARAAAYLPGSLQLALLGLVMLAAAVSMFLSAKRDVARDAARDGAGLPRRPVTRTTLLLVALGVGALTGVVGIGGGFLIVPALVLLAHVPMKQSIGTSLVVIALNSAAGFAGYLGQIEFPWGFLLGFMAVASAGILVGTYLVRFVSQAALKQAFAVFLVVMGTFILYQNRAAFRGRVSAVAGEMRPITGRSSRL